jgi:hypothetical protein
MIAEKPSRTMRFQSLPRVEYPAEVVDRWKKEVEMTRAQIAIGEFVPKTVEEYAAELGIVIDDETIMLVDVGHHDILKKY